jgi:YHS domain-containing protein
MKAFARRSVALLSGLLLAASLAPVEAATPINHRAAALLAALPDLPAADRQVVKDVHTGIALWGFDPVAYFADGRARSGVATYEKRVAGVVWRFASEANLRAFLTEPSSFVPLFGGHDPVAVAQGRASAALPEYFLVREGRLILFRSAENRDAFEADPALAAEAEQRWPKVLAEMQR